MIKITLNVDGREMSFTEQELIDIVKEHLTTNTTKEAPIPLMHNLKLKTYGGYEGNGNMTNIREAMREMAERPLTVEETILSPSQKARMQFMADI